MVHRKRGRDRRTPHIGGSFRLVVPQKLIKNGATTDFKGLLEIIKKNVEEAVHKDAAISMNNIVANVTAFTTSQKQD